MVRGAAGGRSGNGRGPMIQTRLAGTVVAASVADTDVRFFVNNPEDHIQRFHARGQFYEEAELALMSKCMTSDTRYFDVGANVGNHVVYFGKCVGVSEIIVVEPNPLAMALLDINVRLNGLLDAVDLSGLGYGLSDQCGSADMIIPRDNIGAARVVDNANGKLPLITGDSLLDGRPVEFIKIDTEGMEIQCLDGLERTIDCCRPALFVEVDNVNNEAFRQWCAAHVYRIEARLRRYVDNENFLAVHASCGRIA